ncbi:peptidase MA family metallohydrolase [Chitinispirillales bacterium ANBcel5]|uniref:peptidase MA family metallohydrolase n=1 Tax=Cellulosispirillum alkaliphilum TaxID=3039283 RepID=UPI002A5506B3|nr:peptidase MA family metallohydrolase [Chitinispirillales bacterium ANBcel5]
MKTGNTTIVKAALLLICALQFLAFSFIRLEGYVPEQIKGERVEKEYVRIWQTLLPDTPLDTSELFITFYNHRRGVNYRVRLPEWGGGGAIGTDSIIIPVNRSPIMNMDFMQLTSHELVHIIVNRGFGRTYIPRWLHEGLAMVLSGEMPFEGQRLLSAAAWRGGLLSLDTIEYVNRFDASAAQLAYAQSHAAVLYLIEQYGIGGIEELLSAAYTRRGFPAALKTVYGLETLQYEAIVHDFINSRYRVTFLSDERLLWSLIVLLAITAIVVTRVRNRKKLREMEMQERAEVDGGGF